MMAMHTIRSCQWILLIFCTMLGVTASVWGDELVEDYPAEQATEHHKTWAMDVGTWKATMKMYMGGPEAEPMAMEGVETNRMMPGGLWLISEFESGPFKGHGQFGYDTKKKKYVGTWIDNTTSHMSVMIGDYNKEQKEMVMEFIGIDTMTGEPEKMKSVAKYIDDDTRHMTSYRRDDSTQQWVKSFEIEYKRTDG